MNREEMILQNMDLVRYIAGKYSYSGIEREDLISEGTIGLIKAADTFDESRNVQFRTYASTCIEHEIGVWLRKLKNQIQPVYSYERLLDYPQSDQEPPETYLDLNHLLGQLTGEEQQILYYRFDESERMNQKELAIWLGISQATLSRKEKRIVSKLRKLMEAEKI